MPEVKAEAEEATGYVADAAAEHGVSVEEHVTAGEPPRAIRKFVADNDIDLVVWGVTAAPDSPGSCSVASPRKYSGAPDCRC